MCVCVCVRETHLEDKGLVEDRVQRLLVYFGVKLLLLVREEQDSDIRVRCSSRVHGHEVSSLEDTDGQLGG